MCVPSFTVILIDTKLSQLCGQRFLFVNVLAVSLAVDDSGNSSPAVSSSRAGKGIVYLYTVFVCFINSVSYVVAALAGCR